MPINRVMNHRFLGWAHIYEIWTVRGMWTIRLIELLDDVTCYTHVG